MEWLDRVNSAVSYIEENLTDEISYDKAAEIAGCSTFYFQRMFSFIAAVPLSDYIRRRRLTLAAFELQANDIKIIDAALKYGYESAGAFSRAFKNMYGLLPSQVRKPGTVLKAYPKMTFSISIKGGTEMNYRIEQKESFEFFGVYRNISTDMEQSFKDVADFAVEGFKDGTWKRINRLAGRMDNALLPAVQFEHTETSIKYLIGYYLPEGVKIPKTYTRLKIPAQTWAIFPSNEPDTYNVWRRIYSEWFPTSEYEQAVGPTFENFYNENEQRNPQEILSEVWIPIKKKQKI